MFSALIASVEVKYNELVSYEAVLRSTESNKWKKVMNEEMSSLKNNGTWILVPKPKNHKPVKCKWLFKVKKGIFNSDLIKYKTRLMAKGFT